MSDAQTARRRVVASTPPTTFVRLLSFWGNQGLFLVVLAVGVLMMVILAPYTYKSGDQWKWLSIAVQMLAVWGAVISARALASLDVETALAGEIEMGASQYLIDIKAKQRAQVDLDRLEETLVPNNPAAPPPAMVRLFQHICKEARDRRFDSALNLTQPYREEALEQIFRLQNLQKIALWLGILGTFVGMLMALQSGTFTDVRGSDALLVIVDRMFAGLFVSFTASVAGLEVAVMLGFMLLLLRSRQEVYFAQMESAVVAMLSAARHSINQDDFLAEFTQVNVAVRELAGRVYEQARELSQIRERLDVQNTSIETGLTKLAGSRAELDTFLKSLSDTERAFISDVRSVYDTLALGSFGPRLEAGVKQAGAEVAQRLVEINGQTVATIGQLNTAIKTLADGVQAQSQQFGRAIKEASASLSAASAENTRAIQAAYARLQNDSTKFAANSQAVFSQLQQLSSRVAELNTTIGRGGYLPSRRRSMWEALTSFTSSIWPGAS